MKIKLLFTIAIALSFIQVFAQKTTYQRTNNTNNIIADANLKANVSFLVPHDTTTSLRGAPDSAGYLKFNPKTKTFQGYYGSVKGWLDITSKSYVDSVDYTAIRKRFRNETNIKDLNQYTTQGVWDIYYNDDPSDWSNMPSDLGVGYGTLTVFRSEDGCLQILSGYQGSTTVTRNIYWRSAYSSAQTPGQITFTGIQWVPIITASSLSAYVPTSSGNQPNGYFKLDASGNAVLRSGYMDIGTAEYYGGAGEFGGTYASDSGAGGFYNDSPTGRAAYLKGGTTGHHNTDIYDYANNLVGFIAGTKNLTHADSLGLANVKYVDNAFQTLTTFYTDAANSGTTETDLYSYTVPANTIQANGKRLEAEYSVNILGTGGTKYLKAYFAGTALNLSATSAAANSKVNVTVIKTGTTTARALVAITFDNSATRVTETDLTGLNFTTSNILKITGMADAGTGGEVTAKFGKIELK